MQHGKGPDLKNDAHQLEILAECLAALLGPPDEPGNNAPADSRVATSSLTRAQLEQINKLLEERIAERTDMLRVLHDVTIITNEARTIDEAFRRVLKRVAEHNGWCFGHVYVVSRFDPDLLVRARAYFEDTPGRFAEFVRMARSIRLRRGESLPGRVLETGEPAWSTDIKVELASRQVDTLAELSVNAAAAFPVKIDSEVLAVFEFLSDRKLQPDHRVLESMGSIGTHLGLFIVRKQMKRRIAELTTLEQQRIGRDLHDDLGQQLAGLALLAKSLERDLRDRSSDHVEQVAEIASGLKEAQTHVRNLARGLAPVEIDAVGLAKALADLAQTAAKRYSIDVRFVSKVASAVREDDTATELYRIAQEAVNNSATHGKATQITITLLKVEDHIELEIVDDGVGISEGTRRRMGLGMSTMVYRANVIGGELTIEAGPNGGTIVRCCVNNDEDTSGWE